jgi:N-acetylmuramoyl-L-alanine amidase
MKELAMYRIDYNSYRAVKGYNRRTRFLIMHYTAINFAASVGALAGNGGVSAHYLIPDPADQSYVDAGFKNMRIFNLVDENERAWHAGVSHWAGRNNLNDTAIGIEIVNLASDNGGVFTFPPYRPEQVQAIKQLALNILQRYPDIEPTHVLGHGDIAPGRKSDPGAAFPWKDLYEAGIGAWYDENAKEEYRQRFSLKHPEPNEVIDKFKRYGYDISAVQSPRGLRNLVRAFQLHFRPSNYDGNLDTETTATLYALVDKYFP